MRIVPPPVPKPSANVDDMIGYLRSLESWTAEYAEWAEEAAKADHSARSAYILDFEFVKSPDFEDRFRKVAVFDLFMTWVGSRRLREVFDAVARSMGGLDDTDELPPAKRLLFARKVRIASSILNSSTKPFEHQEAGRASKGMPPISTDIMDIVQYLAVICEPMTFLGSRRLMAERSPQKQDDSAES